MPATSGSLIAKRDTDLTDEERARVDGWGSEGFGAQQWLRAFTWSSPDWRLFLLDGGEPVSHVKLTIRRGRLGAAEATFGGVGGVMTPRIHQRRGFSSALLRRTEEFLFSRLRVDYGLLFCLPELTPFYARLGWALVNSPVLIEQAHGKVAWPKAAMALPRRGMAWDDAPIEVCGEPW